MHLSLSAQAATPGLDEQCQLAAILSSPDVRLGLT